MRQHTDSSVVVEYQCVLLKTGTLMDCFHSSGILHSAHILWHRWTRCDSIFTCGGNFFGDNHINSSWLASLKSWDDASSFVNAGETTSSLLPWSSAISSRTVSAGVLAWIYSSLKCSWFNFRWDACLSFITCMCIFVYLCLWNKQLLILIYEASDFNHAILRG
jgi:hypothetical protein